MTLTFYLPRFGNITVFFDASLEKGDYENPPYFECEIHKILDADEDGNNDISDQLSKDDFEYIYDHLAFNYDSEDYYDF